MLDPLDGEEEFAGNDHAELLMRVAMRRNDRPGIEVKEVQHRSLAKERRHPDAGYKLDRLT